MGTWDVGPFDNDEAAEESELPELWDDAPDGPKWRQSISLLRAVLAPDPDPREETLLGL